MRVTKPIKGKKYGYIGKFDNPKDARKRCIELTESGKHAYYKASKREEKPVFIIRQEL